MDNYYHTSRAPPLKKDLIIKPHDKVLALIIKSAADSEVMYNKDDYS